MTRPDTENHRDSISRFDKEASTWEEKPQRVALAGEITKALREHIRLDPAMHVLEYGCGTGMISRAISPQVKKITAMDTSPRMLDVLSQKAGEEKIGNITPVCLDLTQNPAPENRFDLVVSSMTLHHVADTATIIQRFFDCLLPGGWLAVADLAPEDGSFHGDDDSGVAHHGIDPEQIMSLCKKNGGFDPKSIQVTSVEKNGRSFPVLLTWCEKRK